MLKTNEEELYENSLNAQVDKIKANNKNITEAINSAKELIKSAKDFCNKNPDRINELEKEVVPINSISLKELCRSRRISRQIVLLFNIGNFLIKFSVVIIFALFLILGSVVIGSFNNTFERLGFTTILFLISAVLSAFSVIGISIPFEKIINKQIIKFRNELESALTKWSELATKWLKFYQQNLLNEMNISENM